MPIRITVVVTLRELQPLAGKQRKQVQPSDACGQASTKAQTPPSQKAHIISHPCTPHTPPPTPQDPHGQVNPLYEMPPSDSMALTTPQKVAFHSPEGTRMAFVATALQ